MEQEDNLDNVLFIKCNLARTEYGIKRQALLNIQKYARIFGKLDNSGSVHYKSKIVVMPDFHDVQVVKLKNFVGEYTEFLVINIEVDSANEKEFRYAEKDWINFYTKVLGSIWFRKRIVILPKDIKVTALNFTSFFDFVTETSGMYLGNGSYTLEDELRVDKVMYDNKELILSNNDTRKQKKKKCNKEKQAIKGN
jgi:hypothetical protein